MSKTQDGGPAFPHDDFYETELETDRLRKQVLIPASSGMSLRDWFAGQALAGMCANAEDVSRSFEVVAKIAYLYADAMLVARGKQ
jgi:hypothetical protein